MRVSLKSVLYWSFFLVSLLLVVQFLSGLQAAPIVWGEEGLALSEELWGHIYKLWAALKRYIYWILAGYILIAAFVILLEEQNPDRAILWLAVLLLFPFIGLAAYVVFGPNAQSVRHRWRVHRISRRKRSAGGGIHLESVGLERLLAASCNAVPTKRNDVEILLDGDATFGAIEKALYNAKRYIHMEYFSVASDGLGRRIKDVLLARAKEGVTVRFLYDSVGSWHIGRDYLDDLKKGGVEVQAFMPTAFARYRSGINHRDHRKIVVVDGEVGFLGGLNIGDMYMGLNPKMGHWRDTHMALRGEAVMHLNHAFLLHWGEGTGKYMDYRRFQYAPPADSAATPVQIATSGPGREFRAIADGYFYMIAQAKRRIWITTPYLVPGSAIANALTVAAKSGVDVKIIVPSKADHTLVFWATQFNIDQLLPYGIRIFSYKNGFIHSKTMVADGKTASIGTANLDVRSLEVNYEIQAFVDCTRTAEKMERIFLDDLEECEEETIAKRRKFPLYKKVQAGVGRLWSALL